MDLVVFSENLTPLGTLDNFTALLWSERFSKCGSFELWCSATSDNVELIKEGNILWTGGKTAAFIEVVQKDASEQNVQIDVKGRMIEGYLSFRTIWDMYNVTNKKVSTVLRELVEQNCIKHSISDRKIPLLKLNPSQVEYGESIAIQRTGGDLLEELETIADTHSLGFNLDFLPETKEIVFTVNPSVDRTINQSDVLPVVFSSDTEDILSSSYFHNSSEVKTVALVAGEGEGISRKKLVVGDGKGLKRREMYVDARDLQQTDENGFKMSDVDYEKLLTQRGIEYLNEKKDIENFDAVIKNFGNQQYIYGVDFKIGDMVTVIDNVLKVVVNAKITEVEQSYDENGYTLNLIFGYSQPSLNSKLKFLGLGV